MLPRIEPSTCNLKYGPLTTTVGLLYTYSSRPRRPSKSTCHHEIDPARSLHTVRVNIVEVRANDDIVEIVGVVGITIQEAKEQVTKVKSL